MSVHIIALIASFLIGNAADSSRVDVVQTIRIDARWRGYGTPVDEHFTISRVDNHYRLAEKRVATADVRRLVRALEATPTPQDIALRALASEEWLKAHASPSYHLLTDAQGECSAAARKLFVASFSSTSSAVRALRAHYGSRHTDDFPSVDVEIQFVGGNVLRASSHSQHALMLPWKSERGVTWNPAIPAAVASLMPVTSSQRSRLLESDLATNLAMEIAEAIRDRWEELEERCLYQDVVKRLEGHVTIERVYHAWPGQFAAHLRLPNAPANLIIDAHMSVDGNSASVADTFFRQAPIYVARVQAFVLAHPNIVFELWYFDGTSVREDSLQLHAISRPDDPNIARVSASLADAVLLSDHAHRNGSRQWVVLPTGEAIDWEE